MKKKLIRWFNDFRTGYIRLRFCEKCGILTRKNHWSKDDQHFKDLSKLLVTEHHHHYYREFTVYGHIWLCYDCFYGQVLGTK